MSLTKLLPLGCMPFTMSPLTLSSSNQIEIAWTSYKYKFDMSVYLLAAKRGRYITLVQWELYANNMGRARVLDMFLCVAMVMIILHGLCYKATCITNSISLKCKLFKCYYCYQCREYLVGCTNAICKVSEYDSFGYIYWIKLWRKWTSSLLGCQMKPIQNQNQITQLHSMRNLFLRYFNISIIHYLKYFIHFQYLIWLVSH